MKIVVISDTHRDLSMLNKVAIENSDADYFWHLGDSEVASYLLHPFMTIRGNCDFFSDAPISKDIELNGIKFHLEHGDRFMYSINLDDYIKSTNYDVILFGHTHKHQAKKIGNTLLLNPGSLTKPRDETRGSYLIINIDDKTNELTYKFVTL